MPARNDLVELDAGERARLKALISNGKAPATKLLKARILSIRRWTELAGRADCECAPDQSVDTDGCARNATDKEADCGVDPQGTLDAARSTDL